MLVVLTGAKQNAGDFLITERALALLRRHLPGEELLVLPAWESLEPHRTSLARSRAVVILGGPGYRKHMYPHVYPLLPELDALPPVIPLGLGWKGARSDGETLRHYGFSTASLELLRRSASALGALSCRDFLSWEVLQRAGLAEARMTGCPAWYDLESLGKAYEPPTAFRRIAFTPPAQHPFGEQSLAVLEALRPLFPNAEFVAGFHHGFEFRRLSGNEAFFANQCSLRDRLEARGVECRDLSGSTGSMDLYRECDLHVGYRVHAHVHFLSRRRTSFLIHEDGRGGGLDDALGLPGTDGTRAAEAWRELRWWDRLRARGRPRTTTAVENGAPDRVVARIRGQMEHGFPAFTGLGERLDQHHRTMVRFLESLGTLDRGA